MLIAEDEGFKDWLVASGEIWSAAPVAGFDVTDLAVNVYSQASMRSASWLYRESEICILDSISATESVIFPSC
jgi:hypothetical protein